MIGDGRLNHLVGLFADQFEESDGGVLYRRSLKDAPIRVSAQERDEFIAAFRRRYRWIIWGTVGVALLCIFASMLLPATQNGAGQQVGIAVIAALVVALVSAGHLWSWNAPARALADRLAVGAALNKDERRQLMFSRMSYGQLAFALLVVPILLIPRRSESADLLHGWGLAKLIVAGAFVVGLAIQAFRKWRYERERR